MSLKRDRHPCTCDVRKVVPDGTEEEEWQWVVDATKECFAHARGKGVRLAIDRSTGSRLISSTALPKRSR